MRGRTGGERNALVEVDVETRHGSSVRVERVEDATLHWGQSQQAVDCGEARATHDDAVHLDHRAESDVALLSSPLRVPVLRVPNDVVLFWDRSGLAHLRRNAAETQGQLATKGSFGEGTHLLSQMKQYIQVRSRFMISRS